MNSVPRPEPEPRPADGHAAASAQLAIDIVRDDAAEAADLDAEWRASADVEDLIARAAEALAAFPELKLDHAEATVVLSTDAAVKILNETYRGQPKPTNVLSFPAPRMPTPRGAPRFLGDIVLAGATLNREATELGIPLAHHVQHLVVHGLLHLLGHDHETDEEARTMEGLETRILGTLSILDPYAEPTT